MVAGLALMDVVEFSMENKILDGKTALTIVEFSALMNILNGITDNKYSSTLH